MNNNTTSLADALRKRAYWLSGKTSSHRESPWGDHASVISALYEFADVVDSWSGEYLSKEDSEEEFMRRRYGYTDSDGVRHQGDYDAKALTIDERRAIVGNNQQVGP